MDISWSILNDEAKSYYQSIVADWEHILNSNHNEEIYHKFVSENIGLFFSPGWQSVLAITKLRLNVENTTDLIIMVDKHSDGLEYNIIEFKKPSDKVYTKGMVPSATLTKAIQQIQNYSNWIQENRSEAKKLFPSFGLRLNINPNIIFTIIIGRRDVSMDEYINKRNILSRNIKVDIRSYDYLTDRLCDNFFSDYIHIASFQNKEAFLYDNKLANPFYSAMSDGEWRELLQKKEFIFPHPFDKSYKLLMDIRRYSKYYKIFMNKYFPEYG
jgi:hypothetical protein